MQSNVELCIRHQSFAGSRIKNSAQNAKSNGPHTVKFPYPIDFLQEWHFNGKDHGVLRSASTLSAYGSLCAGHPSSVVMLMVTLTLSP